MTIRHIERRGTQEPLSETLLALAASLQDAAGSDDALNRLTGGLADRGIACALLVQAEDAGGLLLQRATLPLAPDVWGRPLRLPRLAAALRSDRPAADTDIANAFTENGGSALLTESVPGTMIVAPLRVAAKRDAVLCLTSRDLTDEDTLAAWGLALQLGAALRQTETQQPSAEEPSENPPAPEAAEAAPAVEIPSLFHELTRRLSYSLSGDEVIRAGLEVLEPTLSFQIAAAVSCRGDEDATTVFAPKGAAAGSIQRAASGAMEAFVRLTGGKHRDCSQPDVQTIELETNGAGAPASQIESSLEAPLVTGGEVRGLLQISAGAPDAFDATQERTFYTVANQISLGLERIALQQQAERAQLASLAESLKDGIVLVDSSLQITSANTAANELLESAGLKEGASLSDSVLAELAREALATQEPTALRELSASPTDAGRRYLVAMAAPLAGSPEGSEAVVILRDVTEERLMQERLLQSEKMVSVGQLVSGVAHELNNPLTGIMGFSQLLLERDLDEKMAGDIETINREAERAAKIVQNLLSFARRRHAEKVLVDLNVLLERVLELRSYDLQLKSIELDLQLDTKLPQTMVDADQIQQVFLNLIINAEQAILTEKQHGTLKVRTSHENDIVRVSFQDDGPGIDDDTLRRIFDPFFTTKEVGEGTGLGLTICYGIIDEHNGRIWAESQPRRGATFIIELPVVAGAPRAAGPEAELEPSVTGRSILVVDDEESIQRLLGSVLQMDNHLVDTASNGREALERIAERTYDLVITDIKMPDMGGRELYEELERRDPRLASRTIFITGDTVSPDTRTFLQQVNNPMLAKPFRVREVRETISRILGET